MPDQAPFQTSSKRVAKNTLLLYMRTFITMLVSLYTSRITLQALGVDNYGIQNAVGGAIAMFNIISGSMSSSISRFITFELGRGEELRLNRIFCTAMNIQYLMAFGVAFIMEIVGVWFLNHHMNIPDGRMEAANWVFQCSVLSFAIGLVAVPYNACIIGHEKMNVFAYLGILDVFLNLGIVYLLYISPYDKLITISVLILCVSIINIVISTVYCKRKFEECKYRFVHDKSLVKEMSGFAGWSFLTNAAWIFNTQGINILINIFFGVQLNAARGIAAKVEGICKKFTSDFMTALNPQITKSYAAGETENFFKLICRGAKFSYFLMFCISLPLMFETEPVLRFWLGENYPEYAPVFFRLSIVATLVQMLGNTGVTACMATGNIKKYTIVISIVGLLVFPFTYVAFKLGLPAESAYIVFIIIYIILNHVRLIIMKGLIKFPIIRFYKDVILPVITVSGTAVIIPFLLKFIQPDSFLSSLLTMVSCVLLTIICAYLFGLTSAERNTIQMKVRTVLYKRQKNNKHGN